MFGPKCNLFAENHNFSDLDVSIKSQGVNQKGITVEDDCWIGSNATILDGVTIGERFCNWCRYLDYKRYSGRKYCG